MIEHLAGTLATGFQLTGVTNKWRLFTQWNCKLTPPNFQLTGVTNKWRPRDKVTYSDAIAWFPINWRHQQVATHYQETCPSKPTQFPINWRHQQVATHRATLLLNLAQTSFPINWRHQQVATVRDTIATRQQLTGFQLTGVTNKWRLLILLAAMIFVISFQLTGVTNKWRPHGESCGLHTSWCFQLTGVTNKWRLRP